VNKLIWSHLDVNIGVLELLDVEHETKLKKD
jgi:hypothetical protein